MSVLSGRPDAALEAAMATVRSRLSALPGPGQEGSPVPAVQGKLLRPLVGYASVLPRERATLGDPFWHGLLAIQMVHEASLLHDDVVDGAAERRGQPTLVARKGAAAALVAGDHLLTAAYVEAARTGSHAFLRLFAEAVERTVAGEVRQARSAGRRLEPEAYLATAAGKSGELFGCATALATVLAGGSEAAVAAARRRGLRLGVFYQMVDDLLDYCPAFGTGKPAFGDHAQRKWTWALEELEGDPFDRPAEAVAAELVGSGAGSPARRCLARLAREREALLREHLAAVPGDVLFPEATRAMLRAARRGVEAQEAVAAPRPSPAHDASPHRAAAAVAPLLDEALLGRARSLGEGHRWTEDFGRRSRSFRFAARLFPARPRRLVTGVFTFCRFSDDLADGEERLDPELRGARMGRWLELARRAYGGDGTGVPLLDEVMGDMAAASVPFRYVEELVEGLAGDTGVVRMGNDAELRRYTYRVAGVVGAWLSELFGVHDPVLLSRAHALGHAMQLTNIVRDVGEDWRMGRVYLPADRMARHGVDEGEVAAVAGGRAPGAGYRALMEDLMAEADHHYELAMDALPALPSWYGRPVAVAGRVYQGIHDEVRRDSHMNGTRRAFTSAPRKVLLALRAVAELHRRRAAAAPGPAPLARRPVRVDG